MLRTMALVAVAAGATGTGVGIADLRDSYVTVAGTFSATWYVDISLDGTNYTQFDTGTAAKAVGPIPLGANVRVRVGAGTGSVNAVVGGNDTGPGDVRSINLGPVAAGATGSAFAISDLDKCQALVAGTFTGTWTLEGTFNNGTTWVTLDSGTAAKWCGPFPRCNQMRISLGAGTGSVEATVAGFCYPCSARLEAAPGTIRAGVVTAHTTATTGAIVPANSLKGVSAYVNSADFVGTYFVDITLDNGTTWAPFATAVVGSGTTYTTHTLPRATGLRLRSTVVTSGTLGMAWSGSEDMRG